MKTNSQSIRGLQENDTKYCAADTLVGYQPAVACLIQVSIIQIFSLPRPESSTVHKHTAASQ